MSFAKRYCDAYHNDFGWVKTGASNFEELNPLLKEVLFMSSGRANGACEGARAAGPIGAPERRAASIPSIALEAQFRYKHLSLVRPGVRAGVSGHQQKREGERPAPRGE